MGCRLRSYSDDTCIWILHPLINFNLKKTPSKLDPSDKIFWIRAWVSTWTSCIRFVFMLKYWVKLIMWNLQISVKHLICQQRLSSMIESTPALRVGCLGCQWNREKALHYVILIDVQIAYLCEIVKLPNWRGNKLQEKHVRGFKGFFDVCVHFKLLIWWMGFICARLRVWLLITDLQIRVRNWNYFSYFSAKNICCGYSKEPSQQDGSFEHPKHMFKLMDKKILLNIQNTCLNWWIRKFCFTGPMLLGCSFGITELLLKIVFMYWEWQWIHHW